MVTEWRLIYKYEHKLAKDISQFVLEKDCYGSGYA